MLKQMLHIMVYTANTNIKEPPRIFMDIPGPIPSSSTLTVVNTPPALPWRIGQRLDAQVITLIGPGNVTLKVGGTMLEARTSLTAAIGQHLHLEVIRSDKQLVLRLVSPTPQENTLTAALREALPHQQSLQTIFSRFAALLSSSSGLSPKTITLLAQLVEQLPTQQTILRAEVLKQAFMDSGLFLEHKLNTDPKPATLSSDLKANLLRLLAETAQGRNDAANTLAHHVETGLARIQMHQLSALTDAQTPLATWTGELPVRHHNHVDVFQFHIEKDSKSAYDPEQQSWCTWLSFNIKTLGTMHVKLTLSSNNIAATLWAELDSTVALIKENLSQLHQTLSGVGLNIKDMKCLHGSPPFPPTDRLPTGLLDIIA
jgi:hypothetical protein